MKIRQIEIKDFGSIKNKTLKFTSGLNVLYLSLIHISEPTRQAEISYAVFCLKKKKKKHEKELKKEVKEKIWIMKSQDIIKPGRT